MKASKNQADAVRSYLSSIGHEVTHVQALEVIARGAGFRSRHVKGAKASSAVAQVMNACKHCGCDLVRGYCTDQACVYSDWPQVVDREDVFSLSTVALEKKYNVKKRDAEADFPVDIVGLGHDLNLQFGDGTDHPLHTRGEWDKWLTARNAHPDDMSYWSWVAAKLTFGDDLDSVDHVYCLEIGSEDYGTETYTFFDAAAREKNLHVALARCAFQKEGHRTFRFYNYNPGCEESNRHTSRGEIQAVVTSEGFIIYRGQTFFWPKIEVVSGEATFIPEGGVPSETVGNNEPETAEETRLCIEMSSGLYGAEIFKYDTEEERALGLKRLIAKAVHLHDGVWREYRLFDATDAEGQDGASADITPAVVVPGDGSVHMDDTVFLDPELKMEGEDLVFTGRNRSAEVTTEARAAFIEMDMDGIIVPDPEMKELGQQLFSVQVSASVPKK